MSWGVSTQSSNLLLGRVLLVEAIDIPGTLAEAERAGVLPVLVENLGPAWRGRLALAIEEAIEAALARRGACPSGVGAATSLEGSLADQLYRARLLELRGLVLGLRGLSGIASLGGVLDADDSAVLRWWLDASERAAVSLVLDSGSATLGVYGPPRPLAELLRAPSPITVAGEGARTLAPEVGDSVAAMELSEPPPAVVERDGALVVEAAGTEPSLDAVPSTTPPSEEPSGSTVEPAPPAAASASDEAAPPEVAPAPLATVLPGDDTTEGESPHEETAPLATALGEETAPPQVAPELLVRPRESMESLGDITEAIMKSLIGGTGESEEPEPPPARPPRREVRRRAPEPEPEPKPQAIVVPPLYPNARDEWRGWAAELSGARGAKPLAAIERMFVSSYVPLSDALLRGLADRDCEGLVARWAASFARSYEEAFDALRVRGKRPTMVLDVPEVALRIGRLHGARSVQLLLIDAMRFDLGLRVEQRVRALLGQQAALAERLLLWSALPSNTEVQLELIGRGPEGLAEPGRGQNFEVPVARGRAASSLRRVKTGHRELLKLDLVEARLSEPGPSEAERLDALADETASVLADYLAKQPPRTLVLAFGDHGFILDRLDADSTRAARHGGSSPEEVLVPAFAWLVGGVH